MRWTEAGLTVALGLKNYWQFTMTGPLGHLGRYADRINIDNATRTDPAKRV